MSFTNGWNDGEVLYANDLNALKEYITDIASKPKSVTFFANSNLTTIDQIISTTQGGAFTNIDVTDLETVVNTVNECVENGGMMLLYTNSTTLHLTGESSNKSFNLHNYDFQNVFNPIGDSVSAFTISGSTTTAVELKLTEI